MVAVAAVVVVSAAGIVGAVAAAGSLQDNAPPLKPAASARAAAAERARADLTAEMAQHANWPQRPVQVRDNGVWVPYGSKDPADYTKWVYGLASRNIAAGRYYVAEPGEPTTAEVKNAETKIRVILGESAKKAGIGWSANASPERTVEVTYTVTNNQDVLDAVAQIKRDYGSMVVVQPQRSHTPASKPGVAVKSGGAG